jgi:ABC-type transport system involved in multi-copper enzyme maturation permease subunit
MKFLAILRDSLRETIDTKVFYVMVGLSLLLTLFAFGISFTPGSPEDSMKAIADVSLSPLPPELSGEQRVFVQTMMRFAGGTFEVRNLEALDSVPDPWDSRYRFILHRVHPLPGQGEQDTPGHFQDRVKRQFGKQGNWKIVEVVEVTPKGNDVEITTTPTSSTRLFWPNQTSILFGLVRVVRGEGAPLGVQLYVIESALVLGLGGWVALLLSVIITAFFIPNMLRKGTVDMLLVKPIHRPTLLTYKYIGGLTFIFLNTSVAVGGVWLALSVRSGVWTMGFLLTILVLTFFFAILYAVSALFGVLTQSPTAAVLLTLGAWFLLYIIGTGYQWFELQRTMEEAKAKREQRQLEPEGGFAQVVRAVHFVLPRTSDLTVLNDRLLQQELITANQLSGEELNPIAISWEESLTVSIVFIAIMLGLASWRFSVKDY